MTAIQNISNKRPAFTEEPFTKKSKSEDVSAASSIANRSIFREDERRARGRMLLRKAHDGTEDLEALARTIAQGSSADVLTFDLDNLNLSFA